MVKIVKNCQIGQVMFPHHSDQISQKSQVSRVTCCLSKQGTRSPIELFWTAKNSKWPLTQNAPTYIHSTFLRCFWAGVQQETLNSWQSSSPPRTQPLILSLRYCVQTPSKYYSSSRKLNFLLSPYTPLTQLITQESPPFRKLFAKMHVGLAFHNIYKE